jgi:hypothetical protein
MADITGLPLISDTDLYKSNAVASSVYQVGDVVRGSKGRLFRYTLAGAAALVKGNVLQESVEDTTYENMAVGTAGSVGDQYIQVTNGTATITSAQFVGGTIGVYTAGTVAVGDEYVITKITGTLTTGGALKVYLDRPLRYAYTTSAKVNMKRSPWSGVIVMPATTPTGMPVGVAIYEIPAAEYGFVQTHGECTVLSDNSTFAVGSAVGTPAAAAGAVGVYDAATTYALVGVARQAAASTHGISVFLQID